MATVTKEDIGIDRGPSATGNIQGSNVTVGATVSISHVSIKGQTGNYTLHFTFSNMDQMTEIELLHNEQGNQSKND